MGLVNPLIRLGIGAENSARRLKTFTGTAALGWPTGDPGSALQTSIIYRMPRDPHRRASMFFSSQHIRVSAGEAAVALYDGQSQGVLGPGEHALERTGFTSGLDVIWVRVNQRAIKWGVGEITSRDGVQLTANGVVYIRVQDPVKFIEEVVHGAEMLQDVELQADLLLPRIQSVMRSTMAGMDARTVQADRALVNGAVQAALAEIFVELGLKLHGVEIINVVFPAEYKAALSQLTLETHNGQAALLQAGFEASVREALASGDAKAERLLAAARIETAKQLQQNGISPLAYFALDTLGSLAEKTSAEPAKLEPLVKAMGALAAQAEFRAPAVSPDLGVPSSPELPQVVEVRAESERSNSELIAEIERHIAIADERVIAGSISEAKHTQILARLEERLAKLRGA